MTDAELDAKLTDAYAEGRKDQLEEDQAEISALLAALAQPAVSYAHLKRYVTANYPNARGDNLTERVIDALDTMDIALGMHEVAQPSQPMPPHECKTEAEKLAFSFGWFKALESQRIAAIKETT